VFSATIQDGRGHVLHKRLFVVQTEMDGTMTLKQPTILLDFVAAPAGVPVPEGPFDLTSQRMEHVVISQGLSPLLAEVQQQREKEIATISKHIDISLNTIIDKVQCQFDELYQQKAAGSMESGLDGRIKMVEDRLFELNGRLERRRSEMESERQCTKGAIQRVGTAWVLPHPEQASPGFAPMVRDDEIEKIAVQAAIAHEEALGYVVESVESENRGFDLISRRPHPEDPMTAIDVRFIEVKGRAGVGEVALSMHEYKTAERLKNDFWLYVVFNCATDPKVHVIQDPARLGWEPLVKIEHYHVGPKKIIESAVCGAQESTV
jgi:hypothetical protein